MKITVVTPSYNQGRFIERTIQSVLSQEIPDLQYLVFDGGSNDETISILKRYEPDVQWSSARDGGQADAVNKGFQSSRGDVIGWLNSDDIYYPGAIQAACGYLESHPDVDLVYGDANHIDENGAVLDRYPTEPWDLNRLVATCYICQPAVFLRRKTIERFGLLKADLNYCMDYEYWLRIAIGGGRFGRLTEVLAGSRLHAETKTLGSRVSCHAEINSMMYGHLGRTPDTWLHNYAHAVVDARGIPRSDISRFAIWVSIVSLYAACRWNQRLSFEMLRTIRRWTAAVWVHSRKPDNEERLS